MRKIALLSVMVFSILIISPSVLASVDVSLSSEKACMVSPYTFELDIKNNQTIQDTFSIGVSGEGSQWTWIKPRRLSLRPGESASSEVSVLPTGDADMGEYNFDVKVYSRTNRSVAKTQGLCFIVLRNYSMEIENFTVSEQTVDPGEGVSGNIIVRNTGSRDFDEINVSFRLMVGERTFDSESDVFPLEIEEKKSVGFSLDIPKYLDPGEYKVVYDVKARGSTFSMEGKTVEVASLEEVRVSEDSDMNLVTDSRTVKIKNTGNEIYSDPVTRVVTDPFSILVTSDSDSVRRVSGGYEYIWNMELDPGEETTVSYTVHYWPMYIVFLVIIFLVYRGFIYLRIPKIEKHIKKTEHIEDEKVFTVSIEVKNRLFGKAEDVRIADTVPSVARVIDDFGTMKPNISETEEGTELRWNIGSMDSNEDRILHYKIKTLVQAVDHLKLPKARVEGKMEGKEFKKESSGVKLEV